MFIQLYTQYAFCVGWARARALGLWLQPTGSDSHYTILIHFKSMKRYEWMTWSQTVSTHTHTHSRRHIPRRCSRAIKHPNTICILILFYFPHSVCISPIHFQPIELYTHTHAHTHLFAPVMCVCWCPRLCLDGWFFRAPYNHRLCRCLGFLPILDCCCRCFLSCACIASYCGRS